MSIYFVTDSLFPHEECIIQGFEYEPLIIRSLDGDTLTTIQPVAPWTHAVLISLDLSYVNMEHGADAFLGSQWIGSTEC